MPDFGEAISKPTPHRRKHNKQSLRLLSSPYLFITDVSLKNKKGRVIQFRKGGIKIDPSAYKGVHNFAQLLLQGGMNSFSLSRLRGRPFGGEGVPKKRVGSMHLELEARGRKTLFKGSHPLHEFNVEINLQRKAKKRELPEKGNVGKKLGGTSRHREMQGGLTEILGEEVPRTLTTAVEKEEPG